MRAKTSSSGNKYRWTPRWPWCKTRLLVLALASALSVVGCGGDADLDAAISASVGRTVTHPTYEMGDTGWVNVKSLTRDGTLRVNRPVGLCWRGGTLAVADQGGGVVILVDSVGRVDYLRPGKASQFTRISAVACGAGEMAYLVADEGEMRLHFYSSDRRLRRTLAAPPAPQAAAMLGAFALGSDGRWFDSWLGTTINQGPYLSEQEWREVSLVHGWTAAATPTLRLGTPAVYHNTVARRAFNRTFLAAHRDTLWTLVQGSATVFGFDGAGRELPAPLYLPVYYRGRKPSIEVGDPVARGARIRGNKLYYNPNVAGLAVVEDSLFGIIRYRDWGIRYIGDFPSGSFRQWARSAIEIVNRRGQIVRAMKVPDMAIAIASDNNQRLAVLSQGSNGVGTVYVVEP